MARTIRRGSWLGGYIQVVTRSRFGKQLAKESAASWIKRTITHQQRRHLDENEISRSRSSRGGRPTRITSPYAMGAPGSGFLASCLTLRLCRYLGRYRHSLRQADGAASHQKNSCRTLQCCRQLGGVQAVPVPTTDAAWHGRTAACRYAVADMLETAGNPRAGHMALLDIGNIGMTDRGKLQIAPLRRCRYLEIASRLCAEKTALLPGR